MPKNSPDPVLTVYKLDNGYLMAWPGHTVDRTEWEAVLCEDAPQDAVDVLYLVAHGLGLTFAWRDKRLSITVEDD